MPYETFSLDRMTFLCISNDIEITAMLKELIFIRYNKHRVLYAENGIDGLAIAEINKPEILFINLYNLACDGILLCKVIGASGFPSKVIVMSPNEDESVIQQYMEIGVKHYITMPFNIKDVTKLIDALIETIAVNRI